jgi:DNA-binding beta-propeller fold protein YncE
MKTTICAVSLLLIAAGLCLRTLLHEANAQPTPEPGTVLTTFVPPYSPFDPVGVAVDGMGKVYVSTVDGSIAVFATNGSYISNLVIDDLNDKISYLALDSLGILYINDDGLIRLDYDGNVVQQYALPADERGVAIAVSNNVVYLTMDCGNGGTLLILNSSLAQLNTVTERNLCLFAVAVDPSTDNVYVTASGNIQTPRLLQLSPGGALLSTMNLDASIDGYTHRAGIWGLAVDSVGNIYVDLNFGIGVFSAVGELLYYFEVVQQFAKGTVPFGYGFWDLAVDRSTCDIYGVVQMNSDDNLNQTVISIAGIGCDLCQRIQYLVVRCLSVIRRVVVFDLYRRGISPSTRLRHSPRSTVATSQHS